MESRGATNNNAATLPSAGTSGDAPISMVKHSTALPAGYHARPQGPPPRFPQNPVNNQLPPGPRSAGPQQFRRLDSRTSLGPPGPGQFPQTRPYGPPNPSGNPNPPRPIQPGQYQNFQQGPPNPQNWQNIPPRPTQSVPAPGIRGPGPQIGPRPPFPPNFQGQQVQRNGNDQQVIRRPFPEQARPQIGQQFQRPSQESIIPNQAQKNGSSANLSQPNSAQNGGNRQLTQPRNNIAQKMADVERTKTENLVTKKKTDLRENGEEDDDDDVVMDNEKSPQHNGNVSPDSQKSIDSPKASIKSADGSGKPSNMSDSDSNSRPTSAKVESSESSKRPLTAVINDRIETNSSNVTDAVQKGIAGISNTMLISTMSDKVDTKNSSKKDNEKKEVEVSGTPAAPVDKTKTESKPDSNESINNKAQSNKEDIMIVDDKENSSDRASSAKQENKDSLDKPATPAKKEEEHSAEIIDEPKDATDTSTRTPTPKVEDEPKKEVISSRSSTRPSTANETADSKETKTNMETKEDDKEKETDVEAKKDDKIKDTEKDKTEQSVEQCTEQSASKDVTETLPKDAAPKTPPKSSSNTDTAKEIEKNVDLDTVDKSASKEPEEHKSSDVVDKPTSKGTEESKNLDAVDKLTSKETEESKSLDAVDKLTSKGTEESKSLDTVDKPSTEKPTENPVRDKEESDPPVKEKSPRKTSATLNNQKLIVPGSLDIPPESPEGGIKGYDNGQRRSLSSRSSPSRSPISPKSPKSPTSETKTQDGEKKRTTFAECPVPYKTDKEEEDKKSASRSCSKPNTPFKMETRPKTSEKEKQQTDVQNGTSGIESTQSNTVPTTNGVESSPAKKSPSKTKDGEKKSVAGSPVKSPSKSVKSLPRTPETPSSTTCQEKKKLPMNKIQVGAAPSPNLKTVRSKIGSLENASYKPGGGKVKIENRKLDFSKAQPKIAAKNEKYTPSGGEKKIAQQKLQWNAKPKVGSLENATYKPGGGDKKIETVKLDFKDKAKPKVGSKDNAKHVPGGGAVKSSATPPKTPQETNNDIQTQKIDIKAESKIGSLENVKHKPGGGNKKIFNDTDYLRQTGSNVESLSGSGSQSPVPPGAMADDKNGLPTSDENLNQE